MVIRFIRENNILTLVSEKDSHGCWYENQLSNEQGMNFKTRLGIEYLNALIPTDYMVSIVAINDLNDEIAIFESEDDNIKYYVALDEFHC